MAEMNSSFEIYLSLLMFIKFIHFFIWKVVYSGINFRKPSSSYRRVIPSFPSTSEAQKIYMGFIFLSRKITQSSFTPFSKTQFLISLSSFCLTFYMDFKKISCLMKPVNDGSHIFIMIMIQFMFSPIFLSYYLIYMTGAGSNNFLIKSYFFTFFFKSNAANFSALFL